MTGDPSSSGRITMTRAERQRREALQLRRGREASRWTIPGNILMIILLLCVSVVVYALIKSKVTGEAPELAGRHFYIVLSGSMEPAFSTGSLLAVQKVEAEDLKKGDVITFIDPADPARIVSHRIVAVNTAPEPTFTTRGDANNKDDPARVPEENVLGKGEFFIPHAGYILNFARTTTGLVSMVLIPALFIAIFEFRNLLRHVSALERRYDGWKAGFP